MGRYLALADQATFAGRESATTHRGPASPGKAYDKNDINDQSLAAATGSGAPRVPDLGEPNEGPLLLPPDWLGGVELLRSMPAPDNIPPSRWRQVVVDAGRLLPRWGTAAAGLGWDTLDLFGAHRLRPLARYDAAGLVLLLDGAEVVALTADCAEIRTRSGALQRYRRRPFDEPGRVSLWDLAAP